MTMSNHPTSKDAAFAKIQETGNLPTLPEILIKLLEACDDENTPLSDIANLISKDPVLSFKVLQLVNSAYYGIRQKFTGIEQAVVYLGADSVRNVAITTSIHQVFDHKRLNRIKQFSLSGFWWHSLMCATLAKRIAVRTNFSNRDEAYLSGLLHDIGRLVLVSTFPKEHEYILLKTEDVRNTVWAESQLIGIDHGEVGAWVVEKWKLNSLMGEAIKCHHESLEQIAESFPLVRIVYLSNLLCLEKPGGTNGGEAADMLFNLEESDVGEIIQGATEEVSGIAESLGINARPVTPVETKVTGKKLPKIDPEADAAETVEITATTASDTKPETDDSTAQKVLISRIKNVSLLSTFLEDFIKVGKLGSVIETFEKCLRVMFEIEKILFFLPDRDGVLLKGMTSSANALSEMSKGLSLPVQRSSSRIVQAYFEMKPLTLTAQDTAATLNDKQLLSTLKCQTIFLIPIIAEKKPIGIVLLGLPDSMTELSQSDRKVLDLIVRQAGLCLHLERVKARQAREIEDQRMAAISMTAKKFAHEINNPLGILSNYLASLKMKLPEGDAFQKEFSIIDEELNRISLMVNQLDFFSQPAFRTAEPTDINGIISNIIQLLKSSLFVKTETSVSFTADPLLPQINTSKDVLKQIVINLLKNAAEAMTEGGLLEIKTRRILQTRVDEKRQGVEIIIKDNGPGLPDKVKKNLFKPFISTKGQGHAGLGLSIVARAVKDIGGTISCKDAEPRGTVFTVYLPNMKDLKA
jgi:putative nucleotidyltransferase with HDIG domain